MQATISLLPVQLSLVHIPRSRLHQLSTHVVRQLLRPRPGFFNITANDLELSIFAEDTVLRDFEPIARRDRQRRRSEPVEISYEKWSVLQIDSHNSTVNNSGARVHEISAPLAAAGISILYQSSYMSDFLFVKGSQLQQVLDILATHGFDLYSPEVLPPQREATPPPISPTSPRSKSHSPTSSDVSILYPDLACVGLSDEFGVDHWGLKIIKLVAYPDLIAVPPSSSNSSTHDEDSEPVTPISSDDDGYYSHSPPHPSSSASSLYESRSQSYTDLTSPISMSPTKSASKHSASFFQSRRATFHSSKPEPPLHQQFFSFTRTPEGSSLTADVSVLAALFPPEERHMVIGAGELDAVDDRMNGVGKGYSDGEDASDPTDGGSDVFKCLQLDLRRFGLDKHGLVNRFSRVLEENGINHMYSSTFKTANLLVDKKQALRAQSLLRLC